MRLRLQFVRVLVLCGTLAASATLGSSQALALDIKQLMGENFQNVQKILVNLVTSNYASVPHDVGIIRDHVDALAKTPPPSISAREELVMFNVYANSVKNAASNLVDVAQEVIRRDSEQKSTGELRVDYLRVSAAQYFGIMVTGCVQCHNQFRRYIVKLK